MTENDKALVERLRDVYRVKVPNYIDDAADRIEALAAENERLREALKTIAKNDDFATEETPIRPQWSREQCSSIARTALGETQ